MYCLGVVSPDHKGLTHLLTQKNLSGRQACWLEHISEFNFVVQYVPGVENVLANALLWVYMVNTVGTMFVESKYPLFDKDDDFGVHLAVYSILIPMLMDLKAMAVCITTEGEHWSGGRVLQPRVVTQSAAAHDVAARMDL